MKKSLEVVFRVMFLFIYIFSMVLPQTVSAAAPVPPQLVAQSSAQGSDIVNQNDFTSTESTAELAQKLGLMNVTLPTGYPLGADNDRTKEFVNGLTITPITAYNLIVDSNVTTPASYGPSAATIGATFCNKSGSTLTNVWAYTGNYDSNYDSTLGDATIGSYPRRFYDGISDIYYDRGLASTNAFNVTYGATTTNPLVGSTLTDFGAKSTPFALKLETGSASVASDGARYVGTLAPNQCSTQYWLISYPRMACSSGTVCDVNNGSRKTVTGSVKPDDDLWLPYFFWASSGSGGSANTSWRWNAVTMRNEISAMANKIWPNGDNKVPPEYIAAIQQQLGWDTWTPNGSGTTAYPGETVTSQGIWYDLGVVGAGFDNNGDFTPDRNLWVQPIGDALAYDPGCFRLVRTYGLWIIKLTDGTEILKAFVNEMYYENVRDDNNGAVGLVFYQYVALDGACTAGLTPYQEVASGYDNEKFNADFGAGIPPLQSKKPEMTFVKTAPGTVALGGTIVYTMTFTLPDVDAGDTTTTVTVGNPANGAPLTYYEEVPIGLQYIACSAYYDASLAAPYYPASCPVGTTAKVTLANPTSTVLADVLFSTDGGTTWSTTDPGNYTSSSAANQLKIQWRLRDAVTSPASGAATTGTLKFGAVVPGTYAPKQVTNDKSCIGVPPAYTTNCTVPPVTNITGDSVITGTVWADDGLPGGIAANGVQDGTAPNRELGIGDDTDPDDTTGVTVSLYWDNNGDGDYADTGDYLYATTQSMTFSVIDGYVDVDRDGVGTTASPDVDDDISLPGVTIIDGRLDINGDGVANTSDDSVSYNQSNFAGYPVIDGWIDFNKLGSIDTGDDGSLLGLYNFGRLPVSSGSAKYIIVVDPADTDIPDGYGPDTTTIYKNVTVAATGAGQVYGDAADASEPSDFGFTPALSVTKNLESAGAVAEGAPVQYTLTVKNNLPGIGTNSNSCTYMTYATSEGSKSNAETYNNQYDDNGPGASPATTLNVFTAPEPDNIYSVSSYSASGTQVIDGVGFAMGQQNGDITNIKAMVKLYLNAGFDHTGGWPSSTTADYAGIQYWAGAGPTQYTSTPVGTQAQQNATATILESHIGKANAGWYELDLGSTNAATGAPWKWSDLAAGNTIHVVLQSGKQGTGDQVLMYVDAIALQVTTNATCGSDSTILNPVPLVDRFDNRYLTFVSSFPLNSGYASNVAANTDEISWSNVGPLNPGEIKQVTVNFIAKDPVTSPGTYNCDGSTGAKFASGVGANSDPVPTSSYSTNNNCAPVIITDKGSLSGRIWYDKAGDGWETGSTTGWNAGTDSGIAGTTLTLYACADGSGILYTTATAQNSKRCDQQTGGVWTSQGSIVTDNTGYYTFDNLAEGFYYVAATNLPTGAVQRGEADNASGNQNGVPQVSGGNSVWGNTTADLQTGPNSFVNFNYLGAGEDITNINFGYNGFVPALYGYIWQDYNGDGIRQSNETGMDNTTTGIYIVVTDCQLDGCGNANDTTFQTTTSFQTDANGFYMVSGLTSGHSYKLTVTTGSNFPSGTWTNTDEEAPSGGTDVAVQGVTGNSILITPTLAAGDFLGGFNFGYHKSGGYDIGDTLFYDWNGNAFQDSIDEGMPNVTVNLYQDLNANGIYDNGEPLAGSMATFAYPVVNGKLDISKNGSIDVGGTTDDYTDIPGVKNAAGISVSTADVIDGLIDIDGGGISSSDDGTYNGMAIIDGYLDINGNGTTGDSGVTGDQFAIGQYRFNNLLDTGTYIVKVDISDSDFPTNVIETKDPSEYMIVNGKVDINGYGISTSDDGYIIKGVHVIDGLMDINSDGSITTADDYAAFIGSVNVVDGYLDVDADGTTAGDTGDTGTVNAVCIVCDSRNNIQINGADNLLQDFGYQPRGTGTIGDIVFKDMNGNGTLDTGEDGISGVTVELRVDKNGDGNYELLSTKVTNSSGQYLFTGLAAGTYRVIVMTNSTYSNATAIPNDALGYDYKPVPTVGNSTTYNSSTSQFYADRTLASNTASDLTADFPFSPPAAIGDTVYRDVNGNGVQDPGEPGISGVVLTLYTFTDAGNGVSGYQSGDIFFDKSGGTTGVYDIGEPYFDRDKRYEPGETYTSTGLTATTDSSGHYIFAGLTPSYYMVGVTTPPATGTLSGDPNTDGYSCLSTAPNPLHNPSDVGEPNLIVCDAKDGMFLYNGTNYMGADFGYQIPGSVGDTVWLDVNSNGVRDYTDSNNNGVHDQDEPYTEAGIPRITISLLPCGADNDCSTAGDNGAPVTTETDSEGNYFFNSLVNGIYRITVNTADTDWPAGLPTTPVYDPDVVRGGTADSITIIVVSGGAATSLGSSNTNTSVNGCTAANGCDSSADSDPLNLDADFGYKYAGTASISGTICLETTVDGVCGDNNTDTSGVGSSETAYDGVTVFLYRLNDTNSNGTFDSGETTTLIATTTTSSTAGTAGDYSFANIPTGVYYIVAIGAPQDGLNLTSTASTVNDGGTAGNNNSETTSYVATSSPDGAATLAAYQLINLNVGGAQGDNVVVDRDFAFKLNGTYDFGDLPQTYSTTMDGTPDGARALIPSSPNLYFGTPYSDSATAIAALVDTNGAPTVDASGDGVDENGVFLFTTNDAKGAENYDGWADGVGQLQLDVVAPASGGWLIGWMDFNGDGTFNQANEMVINRAVSAGQDQNLTITTPTTSFTASSIGGSLYVYARFRLFSSAPAMANLAYSGETSNGEVEDYRFPLSGVITPVTLSYFRAQRQDSAVNFEWSTATETGNVGFNLYAEAIGGLIQINDKLIPSNTTDSMERQDYSYSKDVGGNTFYIEEISVLGETRVHGPFQLGEKYGDQEEIEKIDQKTVATENQENFDKHQSDLKKNMKVPAVALEAATGTQATMQLTTSLNLKVRQTGLYRVSYEMLRDSGLDLAGVPISKITLTNRGQMVPIYVEGSGKFAPGGYIEFYAEALNTLYTETNIYTLQVSKSPANRIQGNSATPGKGLTPPTSYIETLVVNNQRAFADYAPGTDPWYDTSMLASASKTWSFPFQISGLVNSSTPQSLELVVWGATDYPNTNPDHHLKVSINGTQVADERFDNITEYTIKATLPAGVLREGTNTLQLTLPKDTGEPYDLINLDKFSVSYSRSFQAQNGCLTFTATGKAFNVANLPTGNVVVYRQDQKGLARLGQVDVQKVGATYTASFAGTNQTATYLVSTVEALYTPTLEAVRLAANLNQPAQYLIISHPNFIAGLQPLIQAKQAQSLTVSVVDVTDLYAQYSSGIFDPQAIKQYIAYAKQNLGTQYVLLVGGDTYDYHNYLGKNSISFIPSLYVTTDVLSRFSPVDPLYADVDHDNIPDLAIGRFPVSTRAELDLLINKTLAYTAKTYRRTAVFASDKYDGVESFKDISLGLAASLPAGWTSKSIHLDDLSIAAAQKALIAAMNAGTALVTYTGHSAPTMWSFSRLFQPAQAQTLTNAGRPFVAVQWGCFNTYYVDPINKTLVQGLLFSGDRGAVALLGASTRTDSESEKLLGMMLNPKLTTPGMTIGQAVLSAKSELAKTHPGLVDVLLGWTLMGDPALVVEP